MDDLKDRVSLDDRLSAAGNSGMTLAVWADLKPDAVFIHDPSGKTHSFGQVNATANRIVRLLRAHGLKDGDSVALVCSNRVEFVEVLAATMRAGLRITPVNWHLNADEIGYIIQDCEAKAVFCEARVAAATTLSLNARICGSKSPSADPSTASSTITPRWRASTATTSTTRRSATP